MHGQAVARNLLLLERQIAIDHVIIENAAGCQEGAILIQRRERFIERLDPAFKALLAQLAPELGEAAAALQPQCRRR